MTADFVKAYRLRAEYHKASLAVRAAERDVKNCIEEEKRRLLEAELVKAQEAVGEIESEIAGLAW